MPMLSVSRDYKKVEKFQVLIGLVDGIQKKLHRNICFSPKFEITRSSTGKMPAILFLNQQIISHAAYTILRMKLPPSHGKT